MASLLVLGATGLVGRLALDRALADPRVERVAAPTRRPLPANPKLDNPVVDFERLPEDAPWWAAEGVICALGSTIAKAGSREAFRRVDHDLPLLAARLARRRGARAFALVSAAGANPRSRVFYNRVKGEAEEAVAGVGFPSLTILRPSLIGGDREESRPLEAAAKRLFRLLDPVLPRDWRIVPPDRIAAALVEAAVAGAPGRHVVKSGRIGGG